MRRGGVRDRVDRADRPRLRAHRRAPPRTRRADRAAGRLKQLLDLIGDAYGCAGVAEFRSVVIAGLQRLVGADYASYNEIAADGTVLVAIAEPPVPPDLVAVWQAHAGDNPLVERYARTRDGRAYRFSDVADMDELRLRPLFRGCYGPLGIDHQIAFALAGPAGLTIGIALSRGGKDFTDRDRELLDLARPHLIQAHRVAKDREPPDATGLGLSAREAEVLAALARGASTAQVASELQISPRTVQKHIQLIVAKLGVEDRTSAVAAAWMRR